MHTSRFLFFVTYLSMLPPSAYIKATFLVSVCPITSYSFFPLLHCSGYKCLQKPDRGAHLNVQGKELIKPNAFLSPIFSFHAFLCLACCLSSRLTFVRLGFRFGSVVSMKMGENGAANYYQHAALAPVEVSLELGLQHGASKCFDDDGRLKRTGTVWTTSAHIITAVIGSGVLSLAWAIGQLGWVAGPAVMLLFSFVTYYTSALLADCYRSGDPNTGRRNYTYMDAVQANLNGIKVKICGYIQYLNIVGVAIGYTIAASISMV
ncbi:hypothetical protein B296_00050637 [Ensete ventricosum]|uniref:Amino acid transporter transmembrane domain-containing protein n=1 Tax=Ensete ventricosum TaxID=4639 RepID=A0A426X592_ENSVE|nr:hypothetical protein B296_00050637 [Ensete ventricosum]